MLGENSDNLLCVVVHQCGKEWINYSDKQHHCRQSRGNEDGIFSNSPRADHSKVYYDNKHWSQQDKEQNVHIFTKLPSDELEIAKKTKSVTVIFSTRKNVPSSKQNRDSRQGRQTTLPRSLPFMKCPYPVRVGVSLVHINYCYVKIRNFFSNSLHMVERFLMFLIRHLEWFFLFLERTTSQHPSREVRDFTPPRLCKFPALAICGFQNGGEIENTCKSCRSICECYGRHKSDRKVFAGSL